MTIWDRDAHASVDLCVCAQYLITSQHSPRKIESNNDGGKLESLIHLEAGASTCQKESNEREGRYGQLWYAVPPVFAAVTAPF